MVEVFFEYFLQFHKSYYRFSRRGGVKLGRDLVRMCPFTCVSRLTFCLITSVILFIPLQSIIPNFITWMLITGKLISQISAIWMSISQILLTGKPISRIAISHENPKKFNSKTITKKTIVVCVLYKNRLLYLYFQRIKKESNPKKKFKN